MSGRGLSTAIGLNNRGVSVLRRGTTPETLKSARNYFHAALKVVKHTLHIATKQDEETRRHVEQEVAAAGQTPESAPFAELVGEAAGGNAILLTTEEEEGEDMSPHGAAEAATTTNDNGTLGNDGATASFDQHEQQGAVVASISNTPSVVPQQQQDVLSSSNSPSRSAGAVPLQQDQHVAEGPSSHYTTDSLFICSRPIRLVRRETIATRDGLNSKEEESQDQAEDYEEATARSSNAGVVIAFNLALALNFLRSSGSPPNSGRESEEDAYYLKSSIDLYKIAYSLSTRNLCRGGDGVNHDMRSASRDESTSNNFTSLPAAEGRSEQSSSQQQQPVHNQQRFDQFLHVAILNNLTVASLDARRDSFDSAKRYFDQLAHGMNQGNLGRSSQEEINGIVSNITRLNSLFYGTPAPAA